MIAFYLFLVFVTVLSFIRTGSCADTDEITLANFTDVTPPESTPGLESSNGVLGRRRIYLSSISGTFEEAQNQCFRIGGSLLSIEDPDFDNYVRQALILNANELALGNFVWTSGRFTNSGEPLHLSRYVWLGVGQPFFYSNWDSGQPLGHYVYDTCVTIRATGYLSSQYGWSTKHCRLYTYRFLCEL